MPASDVNFTKYAPTTLDIILTLFHAVKKLVHQLATANENKNTFVQSNPIYGSQGFFAVIDNVIICLKNVFLVKLQAKKLLMQRDLYAKLLMHVSILQVNDY